MSFPYERGSTLGLVVYGEEVEQSVAPSSSPDALRRFIGRLTLEEGTSEGVDDALAEGTRLLRRPIENEPKVIHLFDNGAEVPERIINGSKASRAGIQTAVIQLPIADSQLCSQATLGCFETADDLASNLGERSLMVVGAMSQNAFITMVEVTEYLDRQVAELVPNSSRSNAPIIRGSPNWAFASKPRPEGGWELIYPIRIKDEGNLAPQSEVFYELKSQLFLNRNRGSMLNVPLDRPTFCLARPDMLDVDCPQAGPSQTPNPRPSVTLGPSATPSVSPRGTWTPTLTTTPTIPPTNVPTDTPRDTSTPTSPEKPVSIYLPRLYSR